MNRCPYCPTSAHDFVAVRHLNRRRFLKYVGASAAVLGASALGLDYLLRPTPNQAFMSSTEAISTTSLSSTSSVTTAETSTTGELPPLDLGANDLGGYVFHDYNGNGTLDEGEPLVNDVEIVAEGYYATVKAQPQHGLYVFRNLPEGSYRVYPVHPQNKFRYMCRSNEELVETRLGYSIDFNGKQRLDMALMEGYLTMITYSKTNFAIDRYYDHDPDPNAYLWWNGQRGFDKDLPRGYSPNHPGIDYFMSEGNILLAQAPGTCRSGEDQGGKYIFVTHPNGFMTSHGHISKSLVEDGAFVSRGQPIAISGKSGANTEAANYTHDHVGLYFDNRYAIDQYSPEFNMTSQYAGYYDGANGYVWISSTAAASPNLQNHWTKYNDP